MSESCGPSAINESIASNKTRTALAQPEARVPAAPWIALVYGQSPVHPPAEAAFGAASGEAGGRRRRTSPFAEGPGLRAPSPRNGPLRRG